MAGCVLSTVWAQSAAWAQSADDDVRAQMDPAREKAAQASQELRDRIKEATAGRSLEMTMKMAQDAMRIAEDQMASGLGDKLAQARMNLDLTSLDLAQDIAPKIPAPPMAPMPAPMPGQGRNKTFYFSGTYESGKQALDNHNYEKAVETFDKVIDSKNPASRADGAYYWKAYALNKLGKRDEALAALAELSKQFPQSSWLNDAKALQAEVQQAKGQPVSPENQADEDLKLYAINALMNSDADRAVPLLEGLLNNPKMSPKLKERALFVLAQSRTDKAHEIVGRYAKGASNPDLQLMAVQYLGTFRSNESRGLLAEVYRSTSDLTVKRAVLRSFEMSRDVEHLTGIAKSEQNLELRREAVRQLGNMHDDQMVSSLVSLYGSESDKDIKREILNSLGNQGAVKQLIECARKETDPELKREAVRRLSQMKSKEALDYLAELLK